MTTTTTPAPASDATGTRSGAARLLGFTAWDFLRTVRMFSATFFIVVLPMGMYLIFGASAGLGDETLGHGNGSAYIMTSMAAYGAITAMTAIAGSAAVERQQGWGRQLGLTALGNGMYMTGKTIVGLLMAITPVIGVFVIGAATGAEFAAGWIWPATGALVLLGSLPFALYGLAAALLFRSEAAVSVASGLLVLLAFFGNLFMPLDGTMLEIARFTPVYGATSLARWPQMEGQPIPMGAEVPAADSLAAVIMNVVIWTVIFAAVCWMASRRRTSR
ncbi:ABC-2 type transport system permease protein [Brevibacterium sanguinis]|uniref:ABC-2 type transport system permease protein n=2 Tax=Brevibacterium TaxID=1696 RepID=A0A366IJH6_9MICO|nr:MULTISPECIES: ABC transporter permease [Brevibacterium]RBP61618.1 ABC-2 type transport system permease protein [Brevibacterium sanguinis]RBP70870.1 ABC-2 type transport system permease protein [Brevibacterium celere]